MHLSAFVGDYVPSCRICRAIQESSESHDLVLSYVGAEWVFYSMFRACSQSCSKFMHVFTVQTYPWIGIPSLDQEEVPCFLYGCSLGRDVPRCPGILCMPDTWMPRWGGQAQCAIRCVDECCQDKTALSERCKFNIILNLADSISADQTKGIWHHHSALILPA